MKFAVKSVELEQVSKEEVVLSQSSTYFADHNKLTFPSQNPFRNAWKALLQAHLPALTTDAKLSTTIK